MNLVMGVSDRVHVLDFGRTIAEGTPAEVQCEPGGDRGLPRRRRTSTTPMAPLLELRDVHARLRPGPRAARRLARRRRGRVVALLGANGAGKTTTLRAISGMVVARRARIAFAGEAAPAAAAEAIGAARHRARARGARDPRRADGLGEPAAWARYLRRDRRAVARRPATRVYELLPADARSAATSRRARSRAASSRCSRSRARSSPGRGCCCSTSRRSGSRRSIVAGVLRARPRA